MRCSVRTVKAITYVTILVGLIFIFPINTPSLAQQQSNSTKGSQAESVRRQQLKVTPIRTESPRETFTTFLRLNKGLEATIIAYRKNKSIELAKHINVLFEQFIALIDVSNVANSSRRDVGFQTVNYLLDIFGRIDLPKIENVPDVDRIEDIKVGNSWRVPRTPFRIVQIDEGPRQGEFLFSSRTIIAAPRFFRGIEELPLRSELDIQSYSRLFPQVTGPMLPSSLTSVMPYFLMDIWFDTPIWKVLLTVVLFILAIFMIRWIFNLIKRHEPKTPLHSSLLAFMPPIAAILVVAFLEPFIDDEINVSGRFSTFTDVVLVTFSYMLLAWLVWLLILAFFEWIISKIKIAEGSIDANLLGLASKVVGVVAVVLVLAYGGQQLGLPVMSLIAGLGIGGIAVALAIRPTLENLIGGIILYTDKPVRVGDFCSFGSYTGTVETIGLRSTEIRAIDRTLISIPNAKFADMEIVNWAKCDRMLISTVVELRYETTPDQLRNILVKMREMFHAHPRIDNDTIRVRFSGYGSSSLDISIRVYALTLEWNDFFAIKEDVLMRVYDIVNESGSGFAFPSQTLYMGKDAGLDKELAEKADKDVKSWRRRGKLPFPRLSSDRIQEIEDTLDYPPKGSVELSAENDFQIEPEGLSAEPLAEEPLSSERLEDDEEEETRQKS